MEFRTFKLIYHGNKEPVDVTIALGDTVTIRVGDWYFEGKVKKLKDKDEANSILNYKSPNWSLDSYCKKHNA